MQAETVTVDPNTKAPINPQGWALIRHVEAANLATTTPTHTSEIVATDDGRIHRANSTTEGDYSEISVTVTKAQLGLANVDNTSDADKPISDATQTALDGKATSAQGAKADTAVQPGDLHAVATSGSYNDLGDKPTIPPAAPVDSVAGETGAISAAALRAAINVEDGATADMTPTEILAAVESESGVDLSSLPVLSATSNAAKLALTGVADNQEVRITGEGNRLERYLGDGQGFRTAVSLPVDYSWNSGNYTIAADTPFVRDSGGTWKVAGTTVTISYDGTKYVLDGDAADDDYESNPVGPTQSPADATTWTRVTDAGNGNPATLPACEKRPEATPENWIANQEQPAEGAFVDGDKTKLDGITAPVSVADAAERKALSGIVGVTRVIQSDLIGIIWTLVADDESLDSSWIGQPYTVNPDGTLLVNYQLADVTGIVPAANTLGHLAGELRMGDGVTTGGKLIAAERIHHVLTSDITVNNSITFVEWFPDITLDEGVYAFRVFGMFGGYGSGLQLKFKTKATFSSSGEIQASGKWASIRPGTLSDRDLYLNAISTGAGTVWLAHDHEGTHNYYYMPEFVDAGANLTIEGVIRCVGGTGTLDCEFAQSVAIATDLVAKAGSVIEVVKVG